MNTFETQGHGPDADDHPLSMRANLGAFGKLDDKLDETRMDSATMERARSIACELGMPLTDYTRLVFRVGVWGAEHVLSVQQQQILRVSGGVGKTSGQIGAQA